MQFINLTPHSISIRNEAGEEILSLPPSGQVARVAEQRENLGLLEGIEVTRASYGEIEGLPEPRPGVAYIVSGMVLAACQDRADVFAPGVAVRDAEGRIVGARGLSASAAYVAPTQEPTDKAASEDAALRVFTAAAGKVDEGAAVQEVVLSSGAKISAVTIGEEGRGRRRGLLPVEWRGVEPGGEDGPRIRVAKIGASRAGKPKLLASDANNPSSEKALVVFRSPIGYRGSNRHGDGQGGPFPGHIIAEGVIAQGDAGGMGSGEQLIAVLNRGVIVKVSYSGRLYCRPSAHYYVFDGERVLVATREEIDVSDDPIWDAARGNINA